MNQPTEREDSAEPDFDAETGLVPTVVQDVRTGRVRMLGYMNEEALERTRRTGRVTFYSRSREELWEKGTTSGNWLEARSIELDCDGDALLVRALPHGPTCHTGRESCFDGPALWEADGESTSTEAGRSAGAGRLTPILDALGAVVAERDRERPEGSYTARLLREGPRAAGRKVAEEALEVALDAGGDAGRLAEESADLLYHLLVLWRSAGVEPEAVARVLERRRGAPATGDEDPRRGS